MSLIGYGIRLMKKDLRKYNRLLRKEYRKKYRNQDMIDCLNEAIDDIEKRKADLEYKKVHHIKLTKIKKRK